MNKKIKTTLVLSGLLIAAVLLAGCVDEISNNATVTPSPTPSSTPSLTPSPTPTPEVTPPILVKKEIHQDIDMTPALAGLPEVSNITMEDIGFEVTLTDEVNYYTEGAGTPMVPCIIKEFEIPKDSAVDSVSVNLSDPFEIDNIFVEPAPKPVIVTSKGKAENVIDEETYSSSEPYPGKEYEYKVFEQKKRKVIIVYLFPIQYIPTKDKIIAYKNASISVSLTSSPTKPSAPRQLGAGEEYECVIITHPDFVDECQQLAEWKTMTEISTKVVNTTWINNNFVGFDGIDNDLPAKIKQFIYQSHLNGTKYVILAGDIDRVPTRYAYVNDSLHLEDWVNEIDGEYVPCDLYYADLCDWDANDDGKYGAMGPDVDTDILRMKPELSIGKLPAGTEAELNYNGGK